MGWSSRVIRGEGDDDADDDGAVVVCLLVYSSLLLVRGGSISARARPLPTGARFHCSFLTRIIQLL